MARLTWLPEAALDVERLRGFLMEKSPAAAARVARLILDGAMRLRRFPRLGRQLDLDDWYELFLPHGPGAYVLRYRVDQAGDIVMVRVWYSREDRLG